MRNLNSILKTFNKANDQLTKFIAVRNDEVERLTVSLADASEDVKRAEAVQKNLQKLIA